MLKKVINLIIRFLLIIEDTYIIIKSKLFFRKENKSTNIVLIKLDSIGDFILWLSTANQIKSYFRSKHITLICNKIVKDLAYSLDIFDEIIIINTKKFSHRGVYRKVIIRQLSRIVCDQVIHTTYTRTSLISDTVVRAISSSKKIGSYGESNLGNKLERFITNRWYTNLIKHNSQEKHELQKNSAILDYIKVPLPESEIFNLESIITDSFLINNLLDTEYIVFSHGAQDNYRRWPSRFFSKVIDNILVSTNLKIVLTGAANESQIGIDIIKNLNDHNKNRVLNYTGKTTLTELLCLINNAKMLIANESAAIHMAVATNTKSICILGGGHFSRFVPYPTNLKIKNLIPTPLYNHMKCYHCDWKCNHPEKIETESYPCISFISPNNLIDLIKSEL